MIVDITNEVFTKIKTTLPDVNVITSYPSSIPIFPCVVITEGGIIVNQDTVDSGGEFHNICSLDINIFSNGDDKMTQVKNIRNKIDSICSEYYGMNRDTSMPYDNYMDSEIYRYILRYSYTIDKNKKIYRG